MTNALTTKPQRNVLVFKKWKWENTTTVQNVYLHLIMTTMQL